MNACAPQDMLQPLAIDVVSVQSQVVYGRVGNNVAMPLSLIHISDPRDRQKSRMPSSA